MMKTLFYRHPVAATLVLLFVFLQLPGASTFLGIVAATIAAGIIALACAFIWTHQRDLDKSRHYTFEHDGQVYVFTVTPEDARIHGSLKQARTYIHTMYLVELELAALGSKRHAARATPEAEAGAWHAVLGVAPDASRSEVHAQFRALMKEHHPDRNGGVDNGKSRELSQAWAQYQQLHPKTA